MVLQSVWNKVVKGFCGQRKNLFYIDYEKPRRIFRQGTTCYLKRWILEQHENGLQCAKEWGGGDRGAAHTHPVRWRIVMPRTVSGWPPAPSGGPGPGPPLACSVFPMVSPKPGHTSDLASGAPARSSPPRARPLGETAGGLQTWTPLALPELKCPLSTCVGRQGAGAEGRVCAWYCTPLAKENRGL